MSLQIFDYVAKIWNHVPTKIFYGIGMFSLSDIDFVLFRKEEKNFDASSVDFKKMEIDTHLCSIFSVLRRETGYPLGYLFLPRKISTLKVRVTPMLVAFTIPSVTIESYLSSECNVIFRDEKMLYLVYSCGGEVATILHEALDIYPVSPSSVMKKIEEGKRKNKGR